MTSTELDRLAGLGLLKREPPGAAELAGLVRSAEERLGDAGKEELSLHSRFGAPADEVRERPAAYGAGWICGDPRDYDREYCVDLAQLSAFLRDAQPDAAESLDLADPDP